MPGIYMALEIARKSLFVNQMAIQVTSHNIANVNTPGYSRQEAVITEAGAVSLRPGQLGMGSTVTGIRQQVDSLTEHQLVSENGVYASLGYTSRAVGQVEEIFNDTSGAGLSDRVNEFYNAWDDLAANPRGTAERQTVVSTAELLAAEFRRIDSQLTTLRDNANRDVASGVEEVNRIASQIAKLNGSIKVAIAQGQQPNDLVDQRGVLLKSLSEKIGYSSITDSLGQVNLFVGKGRTLVEGESAGSLVVDVNPNDPEAGLVYDVKIRLPGQNGPVSALDTITGDISSGELAAAIRFRDDYMKTVRDRVDRLAYAVASQTNAQHAAGYGLATGTPPVAPTGMDFFVPIASAVNAARNFLVDPAVSGNISNIAAAETPVAGDNRNSLRMADLRNLPRADLGNATVPDYIAGMVGQVGSETKGVDLDLAHQKVVVNYLETRREEVSGVSLDEEMTNLIRFQRAFEASTKMISILDTLLDNVINLKQ
ncbi:MAG: flagellar hook-associated protein FlgK [Deltaproteobacteria bacterium]